MILLLFIAASFYISFGAWINPLILWTSMPLYMVYSIFNKAYASPSKKRLYAAYGFFLLSVGFSYFYHLAWFFDWDQMATGDAQSGLIFVWFPIYSVVLGYIGYVIGYVIARFL